MSLILVSRDDAVATDFLARIQAEAAYLLARQGIGVSAALVNLNEALRQRLAGTQNADQRKALSRDLGTVYLAAAFQLTKQDKIARDLLNPAWDEAFMQLMIEGRLAQVDAFVIDDISRQAGRSAWIRARTAAGSSGGIAISPWVRRRSSSPG